MPDMRYATKAQWADAKAAEMRRKALDRPQAISRSRRRANAEHATYYFREAFRYERMAERFKARGL